MSQNADKEIDELFSLVPAGEGLEVTAKRVGCDRTTLLRWKQGRDAGKSVKVQDARKIRQAVAELRRDTPEARARKEAYAVAAEEMRALAEKFGALAASRSAADPDRDIDDALGNGDGAAQRPGNS